MGGDRVTTREMVSTAAVNAIIDLSYRRLWVGPNGTIVREARERARVHAGDLSLLRDARVGLVPDVNGFQVHGAAGRALRAAGHELWVREEELEALGLARPRRRSYDLVMRGRLLFPLHGADGAVGVTGLALNGEKLRWRPHRPVLGLRSCTELVFSAGLEDRPEGMPLTICADPAAAMRFRSHGHANLPPVSAVIAPGSRQLKAAHVGLIAPHVRGGVVDLFIDEPSPRRARQFTRALEAGGFEVRNVIEEVERATADLQQSFAAIEADHRELWRPWPRHSEGDDR